jgi:hypothetical protein
MFLFDSPLELSAAAASKVTLRDDSFSLFTFFIFFHPTNRPTLSVVVAIQLNGRKTAKNGKKRSREREKEWYKRV